MQMHERSSRKVEVGAGGTWERAGRGCMRSAGRARRHQAEARGTRVQGRRDMGACGTRVREEHGRKQDLGASGAQKRALAQGIWHAAPPLAIQ